MRAACAMFLEPLYPKTKREDTRAERLANGSFVACVEIGR